MYLTTVGIAFLVFIFLAFFVFKKDIVRIVDDESYDGGFGFGAAILVAFVIVLGAFIWPLF